METLTPADVRAALAGLDETQQKIVVGLLAAMIREPGQVREREWIAEQLTEFALVAGGFQADSAADSVEALQVYLRANADTLLSSAYLLFQRVGLDLAARVDEGFSFEEAMELGVAYLPAGAAQHAPATRSVERDLGEQPLARLMGERGLVPNDLVQASGEQLTHKMVTRAMKGRRLTANTMGKVVRAWNKAAATSQQPGELFDYRP